MRLFPALLFTFALTLSAHAQRDGVWFGGGLGIGYADIGCARCGALFENDPWEGGLGVAGHFAVGRSLIETILVGAELNIWTRRDGDLDRSATLATLGVGSRLYPSEDGQFFLHAGLGLGSSFLGGDNSSIETPGLAAGIGLGYDIQVSAVVAISPMVRFVQIIGEGAEGSNRGLPVEGADHPRFVQIGVALVKY